MKWLETRAIMVLDRMNITTLIKNPTVFEAKLWNDVILDLIAKFEKIPESQKISSPSI